MIVDPLDLHELIGQVCHDALLDPGTFVVWIVDATRPPGATPIAYLQPAGRVREDTVQVFRAVGAERAASFAGAAHRIALWQELPGLPQSALGPMLRHELAHAVRWEQSGTPFYEADERLRATMSGRSYAQLPTEREANAAAAAFARRALSNDEFAELGTVPELTELLAAESPADVVGETLALLGEEVEVARARLEPRRGGPVVEVVAPTTAATSGGMP